VLICSEHVHADETTGLIHEPLPRFLLLVVVAYYHNSEKTIDSVYQMNWTDPIIVEGCTIHNYVNPIKDWIVI